MGTGWIWKQVVYETIRYFMKWGMWSHVFICCGDKVYTDAASCAKSGYLEVYEEAFDMPGISKCEPQTGFRGLNNVAVLAERKEREPLITLYHEGAACDLFYDGCLSADYLDMSEEAKRFLFDNTSLGETVLDMLWGELPDDWVIDDYGSYEDWRKNVLDYYEPADAVFPHEIRLDKENITAYDDLVEEIILFRPDFRFLNEASRHVVKEFYAIFEKHGLCAWPESEVRHTVWRKKNP